MVLKRFSPLYPHNLFIVAIEESQFSLEKFSQTSSRIRAVEPPPPPPPLTSAECTKHQASQCGESNRKELAVFQAFNLVAAVQCLFTLSGFCVQKINHCSNFALLKLYNYCFGGSYEKPIRIQRKRQASPLQRRLFRKISVLEFTI